MYVANSANRLEVEQHLQGQCSEHVSIEDKNQVVAGKLHQLKNLKDGQCSILFRHIDISTASGHAWLDNIHLQFETAPGTAAQRASLQALASAKLWMTNVTLQGVAEHTNSCESCGRVGLIAQDQSQVFCQGMSPE